MHLHIWTDGSTLYNEKGHKQNAYSAYIITDNRLRVKAFSRDALVSYKYPNSHRQAGLDSFVAEILAIFFALQALPSNTTKLTIHSDVDKLEQLITCSQVRPNYCCQVVQEYLRNNFPKLKIKYLSHFERDGISEHYHVHTLAKRGTPPPSQLCVPKLEAAEPPTATFQCYVEGVLRKFSDQTALKDFFGQDLSPHDITFIRIFTQRAQYLTAKVAANQGSWIFRKPFDK